MTNFSLLDFIGQAVNLPVSEPQETFQNLKIKLDIS